MASPSLLLYGVHRGKGWGRDSDLNRTKNVPPHQELMLLVRRYFYSLTRGSVMARLASTV